jgi:UTP-glucose-1-phosphate uridylyltransferase
MVTGILPAAGLSSRFDGIPKFLLPIIDGHLLGKHIERMYRYPVSNVWVGASKQTTPFIKPYIDSRATLKTNLVTETMCETVLAARAYGGDDTILLGMPDTYWTAQHVYERMAHRMDVLGWPVVVACWRIRDDQRGKLGQCDVRSEHLRQIIDKDPACTLPLAWGAIGWQPSFWEYITPERPHLGFALQAAIDDGVQVRAIEIEGDYYDCGTRGEYFRLTATFAAEAVYV